jgi:hypothetical protein
MMNLARIRVPVAASVAVLVLAGVGVAVLRAGPETAAPTPPATPRTAAAAPATAPAAAAAESSPKEVVYGAFRAAASGDAEGLISRFDQVTPAQAETLKQVAQIMSAGDRLARAVKDQFGADAVDPQVARAVGTGVLEFDVAAAMEDVRGDRATVQLGVGPGDVPLVRVGGQWKIAPQVMQTLNANMVRQLGQRVPAIEQLIRDIKAGKYKTADELRQATAGLMPQQRRRPTTTATTSAPPRN